MRFEVARVTFVTKSRLLDSPSSDGLSRICIQDVCAPAAASSATTHARRRFFSGVIPRRILLFSLANPLPTAGKKIHCGH
jgi:hypothetical protein